MALIAADRATTVSLANSTAILWQMLKISSSGIKARILQLVNMGLLERKSVEKELEHPFIRFQVTQLGDEILATADSISDEGK